MDGWIKKGRGKLGVIARRMERVMNMYGQREGEREV